MLRASAADGYAPARALAVLALLLPWLSGAAQLILPQPEERIVRDCPDCPALVTLPDGTLISQAPVTRAEFAVFAAETGFTQPNWGCKWHAAAIAQAENHPVVCISFDDAAAYVAWLSKRVRARLPSPDGGGGPLCSARRPDRELLVGPERRTQPCQLHRMRLALRHARAPRRSIRSHRTPSTYSMPWAMSGSGPPTRAVDGCAERQLVGGGWANPPADLRVTKTIWNGVAIPFNTYGIRVIRAAD